MNDILFSGVDLMEIFKIMKPYERVMAAINRQPFDIYPVINPTSIVTERGMQLTKSFYPWAHIRSSEMAALASVGHDYYGFDSVMPYFSIHLESSALGVEIDWGDANQTPRVVRTAISRMDDLFIPPDFLKFKPFSRLLSAISLLHDKYDKEVVVIGKVIGPWTLAYHLYGVEKLILDTILEPEKAKAFIKELSKISMAFARAQFEAGADIVTWAEHCTSDLVSATIYDDFVAPIHHRAAIELQEMGPIILHICGNVMDRLDSIAKTGLAVFHLDSRNDIRAAIMIALNRIQFTGSINNPFTLAQGNPSDVQKEVRACIESGINLISPECCIPCRVPDENLFTMVRTAHQRKGVL